MNSEFCIFIKGCQSPSKSHASEHNMKIADLLAKILSKPDKDGYSLIVNKCCSEENKSYHKDHHLLIKVPESLIRKCAASLSSNAVPIDPNSEFITTLLKKNSSHGQISRFAHVALRMINISNDDLHRISASCQCSHSNVNERFEIQTPVEGKSGQLYHYVNQGIMTLSTLGIISEPLIRHDKMLRREVWNESVKLISIYPSVKGLRNYLGDNVGYYFSWLKTYCILLLLPGSASISSYFLTAISNYFDPFSMSADASDESTDVHGKLNSPISYFRILYGFMVIIWAFSCLKLWNRQKQNLEYDWSENSSLSSNNMQWLFSTLALRPEYYGTWRKSRVTGELELHFGAASRRIRYLITGSITLLCLLLAILANFMLMNVEGYIKQHRSPWIFIYCLSCWAEPGEIFDPNGNGYLAYLPGILHPIMILVLNQIVFRGIAVHLTDFENHKTQEDYDRALIVKRFLFEAVDAYACLAYLGFVLVDWNALQSMLNMMFATDTLRRITCECILPGVNYFTRSRLVDRNVEKQKKLDETGDDSGGDSVQSIKKELIGDVYEPFDDYLEMVLQHGYLVLFAMACPPFVAIAAFLCTWVEAFSDMFKLLWIIQRPVPQNLPKGQDIWITLLTAQAWLGILCNVGLLAMRGIIGHPGVFVFEHLLIACGLILHFGISNEPVHVRDSRRHKAYLEVKGGK